ncbi:hypothetical protein PTMSG1_09635 [Pyrenophora teres f. maculata]|nr:hypothetical protein PTMSG1_09635 [Pyrenophora teres f. maculata]
MPHHSPTPEASKAQLPPTRSSPSRDTRSHKKHQDSRRRSRSPHRDGDNDNHRHKRRRTRSPVAKPVALPYKAKPLSKRDYEAYKPLFQSYLDIQKQIQLDELDEREAKGRWKSFISRWNRGDLARSWYDPSMLKTAQETVSSYRATRTRASPVYTSKQEESTTQNQPADSEDDDDDFGPAPPQSLPHHSGHGPTIPKIHDLTHRNELIADSTAASHSSSHDALQQARKQDRTLQKSRLEDLAPRADPGSRERQLEKKREVTSTLQSFRDAKEAGDVDVAESDLMGDDGVDLYKKKKKEQERQKNEREIRREEIARARDAERDERLAERREKEGKTMEFLRQIARERYG